MRPNLIFVAGTDTGVGKTVLTAFLLHHLRKGGHSALAIKPFCSGTWEDVRLLQRQQPGELSDAEVAPFYCPEPVAPYASSRPPRGKVLERAAAHVEKIRRRAEILLVEGSGGLLVPLGPDCLVLDVIQMLRCPVILVARNRLGTINHTLLSLRALKSSGARRICVVIMAQQRPDFSSRTNAKLIKEFSSCADIDVVSFPFISQNAGRPDMQKTSAGIVQNRIRQVLRSTGIESNISAWKKILKDR